MKKMLKAAALIAAAAMVLGFVSCSDSDDAEDLGTLLVIKNKIDAEDAAKEAAKEAETTETNSGSDSGSSESTTTKYTLTPSMISTWAGAVAAADSPKTITSDGAKFGAGEKVEYNASSSLIKTGSRLSKNSKGGIVFTTTGAATITVKFRAVGESDTNKRTVGYAKADVSSDPATGSGNGEWTENAIAHGSEYTEGTTIKTTTFKISEAGTYALGGSGSIGITELTVEM